MFIEFHLGSTDKALIRLLKRLGYGLALLTIDGGNDIEEIPIFRKLVITQGNTWKIKMREGFDVISIIPWNRFVLNKFISNDRINVITINDINKNILPSKPQAKIMAREGKALEFILNPIIKHGERGLAFLRDAINEYSTIEGLKIVISQGITSVTDVRNPRDIVELVSMLTGVDARPLVSDNPYEVLTDAIYQRGVCL
nr:MAG: hypothetical protein TU36_00205 [Vulcanisaeta sp. AZ3]